MATCKLLVDKRVKAKDGSYNLSIRVINGKIQIYLNIARITEKQFVNIFDKKSMTKEAVSFREECNIKVSRVEKIVSELKPFDREKLRELFLNDVERSEPTPNKTESLKLVDLFPRYIDENPHLSYGTKIHMKDSKNVFTRDNLEIDVLHITPEFLKGNEIKRRKEDSSISSINSSFRDLRTVINYFTKRNKLIPSTYNYPFGKGGYSICEYYPKKQVLSNLEIEQFINLKEFENEDEEFAKDIWELLYRCNGINFADLLRLRWDHRDGNCFIFFRKKTENTKKKLAQEVVIPIDEKVQRLLDKVGDKESQFVLGLLNEGYGESTFSNLSKKIRNRINQSLLSLSSRLNLSIILKTQNARDVYATVLRRSGVPIDQISEMLSHSNTTVTKHYLGSLDTETVHRINENLI